MAYFWVTLAAFVASAVNSIAGGGTFLTFPALTGPAHLAERVANMTSTIGLWPGSAAGVVAAKGDFRRIPRSILIPFVIISIVGGTVGALLLVKTTNESFRLIIPWLLAFATVIFACSRPIARWAGRRHGDRSLKWTIIVSAIQVLVAVYGGYFGAGIGVLMLAGLSFAGLDDLHQMNALKVLLATTINGAAAIVFLSYKIEWRYALVMIAASSVGGFIGMAVARRVKQEQLRAVILTIGIALTLFYFMKNYGLLKAG